MVRLSQIILEPQDCCGNNWCNLLVYLCSSWSCLWQFL